MALLQTDAPAVEDQRGRRAAEPAAPFPELEDSRPLQKKAALFRKEQAEAGEVDLLLVGLHLSEVGPVRQVEGQAGGEAVLEVDPGVQFALLGGVEGLEVALAAGLRVGNDLQAGTGTEGAQAAQFGQPGGAELAAKAVGLGGRHQKIVLVLAGNRAADVDAPNSRVALGVAQLVERDGDLGGPAAVGAGGAALPDAVPGLVAAAALVGEQRVPHGAQRIGAEEETAAPVVVGVEDELNAVVFVEFVVAAHAVGHQPVGLGVEAAAAQVDILIVVEQAHLSALAGRGSLAGFPLEEIGAGDGLLPDRFVESAVDFGRLGDALRLYVGGGFSRGSRRITAGPCRLQVNAADECQH